MASQMSFNNKIDMAELLCKDIVLSFKKMARAVVLFHRGL